MIISIIYVHLRLERFYFCEGAEPETSRISDVFCLFEVLLNSRDLVNHLASASVKIMVLAGVKIEMNIANGILKHALLQM